MDLTITFFGGTSGLISSLIPVIGPILGTLI